MAEREIVSQRGSVGVYLVFSIALSIGAGYGVYAYLHEHKSAEAAPQPIKTETAPTPRHVTPPPAVQPEPEAAPPPMSLAEQRASDPMIDPNSDVSPISGLPGIDGSIERGAVERRFRAKSKALQACVADERATIHATLMVDERGHVTKTSVTPGLSADAESCVLGVLGSISFSPPGKPAEVVLPIAFR